MKLSCAAPTAWSYAHGSDSDSETLPPGPRRERWWGEALLDEDAKFFPLADLFPQGKKELEAIWHALVSGPLESVVLTLREIMAAGNLFRCRSFHVGTLSGEKEREMQNHTGPLPIIDTEYRARLTLVLLYWLYRNPAS